MTGIGTMAGGLRGGTPARATALGVAFELAGPRGTVRCQVARGALDRLGRFRCGDGAEALRRFESMRPTFERIAAERHLSGEASPWIPQEVVTLELEDDE